MNTTGNIIEIDKLEADRDKALAAFKEFMDLSQQCFNDHSQANPKRYSGRDAKDIEKDTLEILEEVAPCTAFANSKIELKSGHFFPDIVAGTHYGIEVKTTKDDKWTSLGNSVFEGVSDINIRDIYVMFGNLGHRKDGILVPEFRFRPYQECLCNISVTHSPRYQIDMNLRKGEGILAKMNTDYLEFKDMDERSKMRLIKNYFKQKAKAEGKEEMPWWMDGSTEATLSFFVDASEERKEELKCRSYAIFFCMYSNNNLLRYKKIALWLCAHYSLLCHSMRDMYTAGGRHKTVHNGQEVSYPHIVGELLQRLPKIKALLDNPDDELLEDIADNWEFDYSREDLFGSWMSRIELCFSENDELKSVPIRQLIEQVLNPNLS